MKMKTSGLGMRMAGAIRAVVMGWLVMAAFCGAARAQQWTQPTAEELSMTSQAGAPGAPAVYLYREQTTQDFHRVFSVYERIKILTEGGKDVANVDLTYAKGSDTPGFAIDSIEGRTIHPDGTIIPFTGKPYDKLVVRQGGTKVMSKVFTLPAVEVGSIVEYRYRLRYSESYFVAPTWFVQDRLYTRKVYFLWEPTTETVVNNDGDTLGNVGWTPVLPAGMNVVKTSRQISDRVGSTQGPGMRLELTANDIAGLVEEPDMPPISSLSYRVMFYYTSYASGAEFWKGQGKKWSKARDKFIGPGPGVRAFTEETVGAGDSPEVKLKKIYAAVMTMENTRYTRERSQEEEHAEGLKKVNNTDDVLARKRGTDDQLAELFAAMVRAAGMHAYVMGVSDRSKRLFLASYMSLDQLDDLIVMVPMDGLQRVFDPGSRYCGFGQLAWWHTDSGGLLQTEDGGAKVAPTPDGVFRESQVTRVADLRLDEHGEADGTVKLTYTGNPALAWRQKALTGDDVSLNAELKESLEHRLPGGMEVRVTQVTGLTDGEVPLVVEYAVKGAVGSPTGKRLLVTGDLFMAEEKLEFTESKRENIVMLEYPSFVQDAVRLKLPPGMVVESGLTAEQQKLAELAGYSVSSKQTPTSITSFRDVSIGTSVFTVKEYADLRGFYEKLATAEQQPVVLTRAPAGSATAASVSPGVQ